jgi:hypothetical protein
MASFHISYIRVTEGETNNKMRIAIINPALPPQ